MATFTKDDSAAREAKWATTEVAWSMAASTDGLFAQSSHGFCREAATNKVVQTDWRQSAEFDVFCWATARRFWTVTGMFVMLVKAMHRVARSCLTVAVSAHMTNAFATSEIFILFVSVNTRVLD